MDVSDGRQRVGAGVQRGRVDDQVDGGAEQGLVGEQVDAGVADRAGVAGGPEHVDRLTGAAGCGVGGGERVERGLRAAVTAGGGGVGADVPHAAGQGDRDGAGGGAGGAGVLVADRVGERVSGVGAARPGRRGVGEVAVGLDGDAATVGGRDRAGHDDQRAGAVDVGVAVEQVTGDRLVRPGHGGCPVGGVVDDERGVADRAVGPVEGFVVGDRVVVDTGHGHRHRRRRPAVEGVGERVGGGAGRVVAVVRGRLVGEPGAAAGDHHGAVARLGDRGDRRGAGVDVGVVGQHR